MKQIKKNGLLWGIVGTIALLVIVAVVVRTPKTCHHVEVIDAGKGATCFEPGLTDGVHCSICGEVLKEQEIIPALGHTTNAGICSRCGESIGVWTTRNYVDEFNEPTYMRYVTTTSKLTGTFSNTAATNEKLTADIIVDSINVSFILYEYGKYQVKSNLDSSYHITIKYGTSKRNVIGKLNSDRIEIYGKQDIADSMEALRSGETVSFYIENSEYTTTQYRFSVDSSNFSIEYDKNIIGLTDEEISKRKETPATPQIVVEQPKTEEEQAYFDAQVLTRKYDYEGAYNKLCEIPDYENVSEILPLLEKAINTVYECEDETSVSYLWVRTEIYFYTAHNYYSAVKWIEYPSINRYIEPIKMSQTDESEDGCIMNYCYKWTVSDDYSSIAEVEIDRDGNEKGEMYRRTWTRMDGVDVGAAIERVKTYMQK